MRAKTPGRCKSPLLGKCGVCLPRKHLCRKFRNACCSIILDGNTQTASAKHMVFLVQKSDLGRTRTEPKKNFLVLTDENRNRKPKLISVGRKTEYRKIFRQDEIPKTENKIGRTENRIPKMISVGRKAENFSTGHCYREDQHIAEVRISSDPGKSVLSHAVSSFTGICTSSGTRKQAARKRELESSWGTS